MSCTSVTSSKREVDTSGLTEELEALKAMNSSLQAYLEHLKALRKSLINVHNNFGQLSIVNTQWIEILKLR